MTELLEHLLIALLGDAPIERVIIAVMAFAFWWQGKELMRVQEKRVEDAMKVTAAVYAFSGALDRNTEMLRGLGGGE